MDREFLRQIDYANELVTQSQHQKLKDELLICECFCVNVSDIREACAEQGGVDLELLRKRFSLGEGCTSCIKTAHEWINKIF